MIGRTISHYRIIDKLGEGGMGVVYRAEDLALGRTVALKFLPPDSVAREEDRARLVHEARAAAALLHPNICPIHEIAEAEGRTFIAMAYLEGRSLRDRIAEGPLPVDEALSIARQIGGALAAAHAKGIVHRDIKPENIMLTDGRPILMDFGLAKVSGATKLTQTGATLGTVAYMSPEQAQGEDVDARSDIWSLAAVLYEMLAGRPAFPGEYDQAVIYRILHEEPEPVTRLRPDTPPGIAKVLDRALRKDPRERYASMQELLVDLESVGEASGWRKLKARWLGASPGYRRRRVFAALLFLLVVAVGISLLLREGGKIRSENFALAVMDFEDLVGRADTLSAPGLNGLLQVGFIEKSPIRVISPEYLQDLRRRLFGRAEGAILPQQALELARKAGASFLLLGQIGRDQGSVFATWRLVETGKGRGLGGRRLLQANLLSLADGIIAQVVPLLAEGARIAAPAVAGSLEQITSASPEALRHLTAAELMIDKGKLEEAILELQKAVEIDSTFALAYLKMADAYWLRSETTPSKEYADKAWALRSRLGIKDRMKLESRRLQLDGRISDGMDVYREMMSRWPDDRTITVSHVQALFFWSFWPEAEAVATEGLAHFPDDNDLMDFRAWALIYQGKEKEAIAAARELQKRFPESNDGWQALKEAYLVFGEIDSAEVVYRRANDMAPDEYGLQFGRARCAFFGGQTIRAIAILDSLSALPGLSQVSEQELAFDNTYDACLTDCYAEIGCLNRALRICEEGISAHASLGQDTRHYGEWKRAILLVNWGKPQPVRAWALEIAKMPEKYDWGFNALILGTQALVELDSLDAARSNLKKIRAMKDLPAYWGRYMPRYIAARIALAEGHPDSALAQIDGIQQLPLPWDYETRAQALRKLKRFPEAEATAKKLIRCFGSRFTAHYLLGQIYEEMGRKADAAREYEIFLDAWANADPGWPQVADARSRLAALRPPQKK